jgi:single-strand DNA-binding protein
LLNHIIIMGRLTRDPEYRTTSANLSVVNFSVAVDRDLTGQGGEKETDFIDCVAWRKTAEFVTKYFTKGSLIVVSGRLQIRSWTDKDGNKRRTAEIVAANVYFGGSKNTDISAQPAAPSYTGYAATPQPATDFAVLDGPDEQLPF